MVQVRPYDKLNKPTDYHGTLAQDDAYGRSVSSAFTAGTGSLVAVVANRFRKGIIIINDSDTIIYLTKGSTASLNRGIRLNANGGSYIDGPDALGYIWRGQYACITSAATKNLAIVEDS